MTHRTQIWVAARYKASVRGRSLAGIVGSNPTGGTYDLYFVSVEFCEVKVSVVGRSHIQRSHSVCGVSEYDHV